MVALLNFYLYCKQLIFSFLNDKMPFFSCLKQQYMTFDVNVVCSASFPVNPLLLPHGKADSASGHNYFIYTLSRLSFFFFNGQNTVF